MERMNFENFKSPERKKEITREELIHLGKEGRLSQEELKEKFLEWASITATEENTPTSLSKIEVAITHVVMKYRLGLINKMTILEELNEIEMGLSGEKETEERNELYEDFVYLIDGIENNTFEIVISNKED